MKRPLSKLGFFLKKIQDCFPGAPNDVSEELEVVQINRNGSGVKISLIKLRLLSLHRTMPYSRNFNSTILAFKDSLKYMFIHFDQTSISMLDWVYLSLFKRAHTLSGRRKFNQIVV